jgi:hypothetical protein
MTATGSSAAKHPAALGMDYTQCWASAWPAVGQPFEQARKGVTSFLENQRMSCSGMATSKRPSSRFRSARVALPIRQPGMQLPQALLIAGCSARLPLDDVYRAFTT